MGAPFLPQISLMKTENVQLTFDDDAIKEIARISAEVCGPWVAMPRFCCGWHGCLGLGLGKRHLLRSDGEPWDVGVSGHSECSQAVGCAGSVVGLRCRYGSFRGAVR